jgi:hypothetical protein
MKQTKPTAIVYVDGFNLYKGQLHKRPGNKWLDLVSLFDSLLVEHEVLRVHYFTARILGRLNPEDPKAPNRQDAYLRALNTLARATIHDDSQFVIRPGHSREYIDGKETPPFHWVRVYKVQEKGSDVKLASQLLMDAVDGLASTYVVVSNDSDLARPIEIVKKRFNARVGVVYPRSQRTNQFIKIGIDWEIFLHPSLAESHQLPDVIYRVKGNPIRRPEERRSKYGLEEKKQGPDESRP